MKSVKFSADIQIKTIEDIEDMEDAELAIRTELALNELYNIQIQHKGKPINIAFRIHIKEELRKAKIIVLADKK